MAIQVATDTDIVERYANIAAVHAFLRYAFIDDRAVARSPLQGVDHGFRRGHRIIEQTDLAQIGKLSKVKSEELVFQGVSDKI